MSLDGWSSGRKSGKESPGTGAAHPEPSQDAQRLKGEHVKIQRLLLLGMLSAVMGLGLMAPAQAAGTTQIGGDAGFGGACTDPPVGFDDYPGLTLTGDLEGCLYTNVVTSVQKPSGVWIETGHETFVGSLNGGAEGTFTTNYRFQGKYEPGFVVEIFGRCQHPIAAGSGTGGFEGAEGRIDFKDIIGDPIVYVYRGHIRLG